MKLNLDLKTLITIITFAVAASGFYYTTQTRIDDLETEVTQLQEEAISELEPEQEETEVEPKTLNIKANIKTADLAYVLGTLDGQVTATHNENKLMYGASSSKPILALANLIKCEQESGSGRCLTHDELLALLTYT